MWKKFKQARSANELFNQASEQWRRRQRFMVKGDEESERGACAEVIRLCQLSIQTDERMGDAYVLLANVLTVAASHGPGRSDQERYEFLQSRASAVIHFWYTLPHRGYPITKNTAIGERLWGIMVDDISQDKSLFEDAAIALMESYRDNLATETTSPESFEEIKGIILRAVSTPEPDQPELQEPIEETLPPEILNFLVEVARKAVQEERRREQITTDRFSRIEVEIDKLKDIVDSRRVDAGMQVLERFKQAHDESDLRQAIGWLTWLFILELHRERIIPDSDLREEDTAKHWKVLADLLKTTVSEARQAGDSDTLLLAVGFCEWAGLSAHCDEILRVVYDRVGKQAVDSRLRDLERQPRMMAESLLVSRLQRHLGKS